MRRTVRPGACGWTESSDLFRKRNKSGSARGPERALSEVEGAIPAIDRGGPPAYPNCAILGPWQTLRDQF